MKLLVGLGNPGKKYEQTWHNLGFMTLDQLATSPPEEFFKFQKNLRLKADVCEGTNPQEKLILVKPQTFMNKSGEAIKDLVNFYKIKPENLAQTAVDISLNTAVWQDCLNSPATDQILEADLALVQNLGLKTSPVIFVNNKKVNLDKDVDLNDLLNKLIDV